MQLIMTLLVRDEEDIIAANLDFHIKQGVDHFLITDNCSADATPEIISRYVKKGLATYWYEPQDNFDQAVWVTRMARIAATKYDADWVINNDADEFWMPIDRSATLKSVLAAVPSAIQALEVPRRNCPPMDIDGAGFFATRMIFRERFSQNALHEALPPKVCHRSHGDIQVAQGNHSVSLAGNIVSSAPAAHMHILHYPLRSYRQFEQKIVKGGTAYANNTTLPQTTGMTWRTLYRHWEEGRLLEYYLDTIPAKEKLPELVVKGDLIRDNSVESILADDFSSAVNVPVKQSKPGKRGIVTLCDANYFQGLILLHKSVQETFPAPIACYDAGLTDEQRSIAAAKNDLMILQLPDNPLIRRIYQEMSSAPPLAKRDKRVWPLWICPILIREAPFDDVIWMDCDLVVLRNLQQLFRAIEDGPVFTPENKAPEATPNKPLLYELLPIKRTFVPDHPVVNAGVSGWRKDRDAAALAAYILPIARAVDDSNLRSAISWHDQGALIWAIQCLGLEHRVFPDTTWNLCADKSPIAGLEIPWDERFLEVVRRAVPDANILHWNGCTPPWVNSSTCQ